MSDYISDMKYLDIFNDLEVNPTLVIMHVIIEKDPYIKVC